MALHSGACTPEGLAAEVVAHKGLRGVIQAKELVPMADPRPESVQESRLRLIVNHYRSRIFSTIRPLLR